MTARGPKPKPTATKKAAGTLRKHRQNAAEPVFSADGVYPPDVIANDMVALAEWNRIAPDLVRVRIVTNVDVAVLAAYCNSFARWQMAEEKLRRDGLLVEAPRTKVPMHNPYRDIARQERSDCIRFAAELGISPSARTRVKGVEAPPSSPRPGFAHLRSIK